IELVDAGERKGLVVAQARADETIGSTRVDNVRRALAIDRGLSVAGEYVGRIAIDVDADPVLPGPPDYIRQVWCIDFDDLIRIEAADAHVQRALRQLQLHDPVVEIEQRDTGHRTEANRRRANL